MFDVGYKRLIVDVNDGRYCTYVEICSLCTATLGLYLFEFVGS
jgi:hypothetical protein